MDYDWKWPSNVLCFMCFSVLFFFRFVDAILIPTPFYGVITEDLHLYSDVKLFHVPLDCEVGRHSQIYLHVFVYVCVYVHTIVPYCLYTFSVTHIVVLCSKLYVSTCMFLFSVLKYFLFLFFSFDLQASGKDSRPFHLTVAKLEEGLKRAKQEVIHECIYKTCS